MVFDWSSCAQGTVVSWCCQGVGLDFLRKWQSGKVTEWQSEEERGEGGWGASGIGGVVGRILEA